MIGKPERQYLSSLKVEVEDFCLENNIQTLDEFCHAYGYPSDVVNEYYTQTPPAELIQKIRTARWIKRSICTVLALVTCFLVIFGVHMYLSYQEFADAQPYSIEEVIE